MESAFGEGMERRVIKKQQQQQQQNERVLGEGLVHVCRALISRTWPWVFFGRPSVLVRHLTASQERLLSTASLTLLCVRCCTSGIRQQMQPCGQRMLVFSALLLLPPPFLLHRLAQRVWPSEQVATSRLLFPKQSVHRNALFCLVWTTTEMSELSDPCSSRALETLKEGRGGLGTRDDGWSGVSPIRCLEIIWGGLCV